MMIFVAVLFVLAERGLIEPVQVRVHDVDWFEELVMLWPEQPPLLLLQLELLPVVCDVPLLQPSLAADDELLLLAPLAYDEPQFMPLPVDEVLLLLLLPIVLVTLWIWQLV